MAFFCITYIQDQHCIQSFRNNDHSMEQLQEKILTNNQQSTHHHTTPDQQQIARSHSQYPHRLSNGNQHWVFKVHLLLQKSTHCWCKEIPRLCHLNLLITNYYYPPLGLFEWIMKCPAQQDGFCVVAAGRFVIDVNYWVLVD